MAVLCAAVLSGSAWAAVDINSADEATLHTIKGIGPAKAKAIVSERDARGPFKDAGDLAQRVKGIGRKSIKQWQGDGLSFGARRTASGAGAARHAPANVRNAGAGAANRAAAGTIVVRK